MDARQLRREVHRLVRLGQQQQRAARNARHQAEVDALSVSLRAGGGPRGDDGAGAGAGVGVSARRGGRGGVAAGTAAALLAGGGEPLGVYPGSPRVGLLAKWVQAACALHGLGVADFRSGSFGDGRALCYLVGG